MCSLNTVCVHACVCVRACVCVCVCVLLGGRSMDYRFPLIYNSSSLHFHFPRKENSYYKAQNNRIEG